uniref:60S ribosomal protein L18a n=1 Tax=Euglena gracilis TaxID=3039 RepID=A0A7L5NT23_EUGGR|nr:60S large subunit ribosomal protein eL20 [Euglena gracilis]6ZJ3_Lg Chain Lg, Ribosomal protein eL20 [Euglena gracilis]
MPGFSGIRHYEIVGRAYPTEKEPSPKVYKMTVFAKNSVVGKARFWKLMRKQNKVKKTHGQVLQIRRIFEKNPNTIKNYSILLRYQSKTGVMNVSKEYRDTTLCGAVHQMYMDMAGRHHARYLDIDIIGTTVLKPSQCLRPHIRQFLQHKVKFPLLHRITKKLPQHKATFLYSKPSTYRSGFM